jgi:hypothetical protein
MVAAIDAAVVIGVITTALNLGDFVLRPHQKERFQRAVEAFTLWLDYRRPLSWLTRLSRIPRNLMSVCGLAIFIFGVLSMLRPAESRALRLASLPIMGVGASVIVMAEWWNTTQGVFAYAAAEASLATYFRRSWEVFRRSMKVGVALTIASLVFAFILLAVLGAIELAIGPSSFFSVVFGILWAGLPVAVWWIIFTFWPSDFAFSEVAVPALFFAGFALATLWLAEHLLRASRALCWRIVEYSKGAFAAIILLVTIALGIAKLLLTSGS